MRRCATRPVDPERLFLSVFRGERGAFWLDGAGQGRFSFMGAAGPLGHELTWRAGAMPSIFDRLTKGLAAWTLPSDPLPFAFRGGYVGWFAYDAGGPTAPPDAYFVFTDRFVAVDHERDEVHVVALAPEGDAHAAEAWVRNTLARLPRGGAPDIAPRPQPLHARLTVDRPRYLADIEHCRQRIREGEAYQLCLTQQVEIRTDLDPLLAYRALRRRNPVPFGAYLRCGDHQILCGSPERFLKVDRHGMAEARPMKGTAPRERDPEADVAARTALRESDKDRAENLMIVDLLRNDLGRVCIPGSVHVPSLHAVETYATVHQMVSTVRGTLRPDKRALDCLRAAFPGGSMTGAPKIRAMELLAAVEHGPRGVYSGTIGYLGLDGAADFNIVIRTLVATPGRMSLGIGGGITILSDAELEFEETLWKARAPLEALLHLSCPDAAPPYADVCAALRRRGEFARHSR